MDREGIGVGLIKALSRCLKGLKKIQKNFDPDNRNPGQN
jgi:hypothetical protein